MKINIKGLIQKVRFAVVELAKGGLPLGNSVANVIEHFSGKDLATGEPKNIDLYKLLLKAIGAGIMVYLFVAKYITIDQILDYIRKYLA